MNAPAAPRAAGVRRPACSGGGSRRAAAAAAAHRPRSRPGAPRLPLPPLRAASVEFDLDALSSVDIEAINYDAAGGLYTVQGCLLSPASPDHVYKVRGCGWLAGV